MQAAQWKVEGESPGTPRKSSPHPLSGFSSSVKSGDHLSRQVDGLGSWVYEGD